VIALPTYVGFANSLDEPEALVMAKGFAVVVICIGILVTVDFNVYDGTYTDHALQMLRQIGYSFAY
jgi:hypothetical protein